MPAVQRTVQRRRKAKKEGGLFDPDLCSTPRTGSTEVSHIFTTLYCMFGLLGYSIISFVAAGAINDAPGERISIRSEPPWVVANLTRLVCSFQWDWGIWGWRRKYQCIWRKDFNQVRTSICPWVLETLPGYFRYLSYLSKKTVGCQVVDAIIKDATGDLTGERISIRSEPPLSRCKFYRVTPLLELKSATQDPKQLKEGFK